MFDMVLYVLFLNSRVLLCSMDMFVSVDDSLFYLHVVDVIDVFIMLFLCPLSLQDFLDSSR